MRFQLLQGPLSDPEKLNEVPGILTPMTFRDICSH